MPQSPLFASFVVNRQNALMRAAAKRRIMQLIPLLLVFYSFLMLPPEVEFRVFGVNFQSYRIALLLVSVPALWSSMRTKKGPVQFMDVAMIIVGFWTMLSFMVVYGFEVGLIRGAGITIDTVLPYFVARVSIRSLDDLRYFLILCLPGLAFAGGSMLIESLSGRLMVRPAFASVFGSLDAYAGGEVSGSIALRAEYRLGLLRAYGPFPHPILGGAILVGFLPLYYFSGLRSWPYIGGIFVALTGLFGLSSAAFLAMFLCVGSIVIYHVKAYIPKITWWTITGLLLLLIWSLHIASKNGIFSVISRLTLTPTTAEYRTTIWEIGSQSVAKHPWFGIGYKQWERLWWMGESVDAHFLLLAMRHGLVVPIALTLAIIYGMVRLGMIVPFLSPRDRAFAIGINLSLGCFFMVGQTVNYFSSANLVLMAVIAFVASAVSWGNDQIEARKRQLRAQNSRMVVA
jgi:hypothetical protein